MKKVNRLPTALAVGVLLMGCAAPAWSLGFGRPVSRAILGETFSATVPLRLEAGEDVSDECLVADVYFGDDQVSPQQVRAQLLPGKGLDRTVRVSTSGVINEPVVTLYLAAGCKAKVSRKFVAFADPPHLAPPVVAEPLVAQDDASPAVQSPIATPVQGSAARVAGERVNARPRSGVSPRAPGSAPAGGVAATGTSASDASPSRQVLKASSSGQGKTARPDRERLSAKLDAPRKSADAPRLLLDPVEADAMVAPGLVMSSEMRSAAGDLDSQEARDRRAAAAALWAAMNASPEQLARDRLRMQELEQRLARLQQDAASAREKVLSMEARVREAEDGRLNHPLIWGLGGVSVILAGALAFVVRRQKKQEAQASWWHGSEAAATDEAPIPGAGSPALTSEPVLDRTSAEFVAVVASPESATLAAGVPADAVVETPLIPPIAPAAPVLHAPVVSAVNPEASEAARSLTVEELIDLEQQAEFFIVLGQEDAAVELLESHVQNTAGPSPLPYLKLLEIYQRLGRRDAYERVQADFNRRFNAYAPSWESDLQHGHDLTAYPGVVERLQGIWSAPAQAMQVLQSSLTRPDDSVETFDLPAYRELLFLYAVARDLSERESQDRAPVDLLGQEAQLLHGAPELVATDAPQFEPLMATRPVKASPDAKPSISLDLSLDDLGGESVAHIDLPAIEPERLTSSGPITQHGNEIAFEHIDIPTDGKS